MSEPVPARPKKHINPRNKTHISMRLHPSTIPQLQKLSKSAGVTTSEYVRQILEAHVRGLVYCPGCKYTHSIKHGEGR